MRSPSTTSCSQVRWTRYPFCDAVDDGPIGNPASCFSRAHLHIEVFLLFSVAVPILLHVVYFFRRESFRGWITSVSVLVDGVSLRPHLHPAPAHAPPPTETHETRPDDIRNPTAKYSREARRSTLKHLKAINRLGLGLAKARLTRHRVEALGRSLP